MKKQKIQYKGAFAYKGKILTEQEVIELLKKVKW
jgi:hypothetical protein